jgi:hypothetical protein
MLTMARNWAPVTGLAFQHFVLQEHQASFATNKIAVSALYISVNSHFHLWNIGTRSCNPAFHRGSADVAAVDTSAKHVLVLMK